jgi:hypothetical protein
MKERKAMIHHLKTDMCVFKPVLTGEKTHEIRFDDRGFQLGDILHLMETEHTGEEMKAGSPLKYTGADCYVIVTHILRGPVYGLDPEWVIMSIRKPSFVVTVAEINRHLAEYERMNFPCCGGSGHIEDCDDPVQKLKDELGALKKEANMLCLLAQPILGDPDNFLIMKKPLDKLAALAGEARKHSRNDCPKFDTWFANGGACGKAWECDNCVDAPKAALDGEG